MCNYSKVHIRVAPDSLTGSECHPVGLGLVLFITGFRLGSALLMDPILPVLVPVSTFSSPVADDVTVVACPLLLLVVVAAILVTLVAFSPATFLVRACV